MRNDFACHSVIAWVIAGCVFATMAPQVQAQEDGAAGDIVVTAQRRSEKQSEVPLSVTAFSGEGLKNTGVADARALTQITPGLNFQSVGSSAQPVIRGIGSSGSSVGDSSNVAIYIDGVYQPFQAANFQRFPDLKQIEVLKGPQGTLFGRNAAGGAINITTLDPVIGDATGNLGVSYARFDEVEANGFVSVPLSDRAAFSLSGNYVTSDGFRRDINLDKKLGYIRSHRFRGKLLVEPSDETRIVFSGYYSRTNDLTTFGNQPLDGNALVRALVPDVLIAEKPNTSALNLVPINRVTTWGGSMKIEQDLDFATLTSLTAFSKARQYVETDSDLTPVSYSASRIRFGDDMVSQDLTLASNGGGRLQWLLGGTYYKEKGFYTLRSYGGLLTEAEPPLTSGTNVHDIEIEAVAVFGELTYRLTDRLTVIAGARYSNDKPRFSGVRITPATGEENPATAASSKDSFSSFTPRLSLRYALAPTLNAYATYSRGFKSGVFNGNSLQVAAVKPETVDAYEIGLKGNPSRTISFDAAGYYYKYKNLQVASFGETSISPILRNAASAEIYGFEGNFTVRPVQGLSFRGGVAYTHGEYEKFERAQGFAPATDGAGVPIGGNSSYIIADASGNRLIRTPRLQLNGTISYEMALADGGHVDFNLTGSRNSAINHDVEGHFRQPAFAVFNGNIAYSLPDDHWRITAFGNNIFNEKYIAGILISGLGTSVTYARPATYGLKIEYLF